MMWFRSGDERGQGVVVVRSRDEQRQYVLRVRMWWSGAGMSRVRMC